MMQELLWFLLFALIIGGAVYFVMKNKKKKVEPPKPDPYGLQSYYASVSDLTRAIEHAGYPRAVYIDGNPIHAGSEPAARFKTMPDGSLRKQD